MFEIGGEIDKATEKLAQAIAEQHQGRVHLGVMSEVIAELMCRVDAQCSAVQKKRRRAA